MTDNLTIRLEPVLWRTKWLTALVPDVLKTAEGSQQNSGLFLYVFFAVGGVKSK